MGIEIGLLGTMSVLIDGRPLPKMRSRKAKWLLALLALRLGKPIGRTTLAGMLWPDTNGETARANLRAVVSELRRALGREADRLQSIDRNTLAFDFSGVEIDLAAFDAAIQVGNWETAATLYVGPLLQDCDEEWVRSERSVRDRQCLAALRELVHDAEAGKAVEWAQRAVAVAPWQDGARRDLMSAYVRAGDLNAALAAYRDFAKAIRDDSGGIPDAQTTELYTRIRSGKERVERSPGISKVPVTSSFVGREDERVGLAQDIRSWRLVTLCGEGGIGKTRLAQEMARDLRREFADGVCFVSLEDAQGEESVLYAIVASLSRSSFRKSSLIDEVLRCIGGKELLLILDNCEHVLPACARLANRLLVECPKLRILATSREPLGLAGERVWSVPGLTAPDPGHLPERSTTLVRVLMGYESVRLFVERAQVAARTFEVTSDNAIEVAELCSILEGSPLAIELAAGRARTMSVSDLLTRFREDRLDFLSAPRRADASRHQTLRRTLDWSFSLLEAGERRMFARLAIFAGGWTLEAAEEVAGISPAVLESLVEKSLVKFSTGGRYAFLETVRRYAAERLAESGEASRLEQRHSEYYASLGERLADESAPIAAFDRELGNFNAALDRDQGDPETALRLAGALSGYWRSTFSLTEGRKRIEAALARYPVLKSSLRAHALNHLGGFQLGEDVHLAIDLFERSQSMFREVGERGASGRALHGLGLALFYAANYDRAAIVADECIALAREVGDRRLLADVTGLRSYLYLTACDYARSRALGYESLGLAREVSPRKMVAGMLRTLGALAYELGDYDLYRQHNEEALALNRLIGYEDGVAWCLVDLGKAATDLGQCGMGEELIQQGLDTMRKREDRYGTASALETLGMNHLAQGNIESARRLLGEALASFRFLKDKNGIGRVMDVLGDAATGVEADAHYRDALAVWRDLKHRKRMRDSFLRMGNVATNPDRSIRLWAHAYRMGASMGVPIPIVMRARHDQAIGAAKREPRFDALWAEGEEMTLESALDLALGA